MESEGFGKNKSFEDVSATVLTKVDVTLLTKHFFKMFDPHDHINLF